MKIQILQLEPSDDRASVSDKLNWAQAPRVLLIWPPSGRILTRRLDLVLLQRAARRKGAQLGLVTRDPDVLDLAAELGIPTFDTPDAAAGEAWRRGRTSTRPITRRPPPLDLVSLRPRAPGPAHLHPLLRWPLFMAACASVIAIAVTVIPSATIRLPLAAARQEMQITLLLDPSLRSSSSADRIPALTVRTRLREEMRVPTTGTTFVPSEPARGTVLLTNLANEPVTVPAGTGLRASGFEDFRFLTLDSVIVPAGAGSAASAAVVAAEPGSRGNLPAGAIDAVEGPLGILLRVTNPEPTAAGTDAARPAVALADRARLLRDATSLLLQRGEADLGASLDPGLALAAGTARIVREYVRTYDHEVGEPADSVGLVLEAEVAALAYRWTDVEAAARAALEASAPGKIEAPGSLRVSLRSDPATDASGQTRLFVVAERRVASPPASISILPRLLGRSPAEAASVLAASLELASPPLIELVPPWWPWMPLVAARIQVVPEWAE